MTFWNWRRGSGGSATAGTAALANGTDLAPIELYTPDTRVVGWIASNGQRVTDLLLATEELRLWQPSGGGEDMTVRPVLDTSGDWRTVPTEDVVVVMPPEWRTNRQLRLHRRIQRVRADLGQRCGLALSLCPRARVDVDLAGQGQLDPRALEGPAAARLREACQAHAEPHGTGPGGGAAPREQARIVGTPQPALQDRGEIAGVEHDGHARARRPHAVRHLVGPDQVAPADLRGIEAELVGEEVERALAHEARGVGSRASRTLRE